MGYVHAEDGMVELPSDDPGRLANEGIISAADRQGRRSAVEADDGSYFGVFGKNALDLRRPLGRRNEDANAGQRR